LPRFARRGIRNLPFAGNIRGRAHRQRFCRCEPVSQVADRGTIRLSHSSMALSGGMVHEATEAWRQLATRIPKELHRRLKLHCVTNDKSVMHFVVQAIE